MTAGRTVGRMEGLTDEQSNRRTAKERTDGWTYRRTDLIRPYGPTDGRQTDILVTYIKLI